jgi:hypothetical protein
MNLFQLYTVDSYRALVSRYGSTSADMRMIGAALVLAFLLSAICMLIYALHAKVLKPLRAARRSRKYWRRVHTDWTRENLEHAGL